MIDSSIVVLYSTIFIDVNIFIKVLSQAQHLPPKTRNRTGAAPTLEIAEIRRVGHVRASKEQHWGRK